MSVVFSNGCFDGLHEGHLKLLKYCKGIDNVVIIGLNSDASIKKIKGFSRPLNNISKRIKDLEATGLVTEIIVFDSEEELEQIIKDVKPEILVKGSDYKNKHIVGSDLVLMNGGKIEYVNLFKGYSTSVLNVMKTGYKFLITGGMGFIGSNFIEFLNRHGISNIDIVEKLDDSNKWKNISGLEYKKLIDVDNFNFKSLKDYHVIVNLGACSSTKEKDLKFLIENNTNFLFIFLYFHFCPGRTPANG